MSGILFTIGHSTRSAADLIATLAAHGIARVVDVRMLPRSRRHPQFNAEALAQSLGAAGIEYRHVPALGGLRTPLAGSVNLGIEETAFRGYADHMSTREFRLALDELLALARSARTVAMCAEVDWRRCHRALLADAVVARGFTVEHIRDAAAREPHRVHPAARIADGVVTYPASQGRLAGL